MQHSGSATYGPFLSKLQNRSSQGVSLLLTLVSNQPKKKSSVDESFRKVKTNAPNNNSNNNNLTNLGCVPLGWSGSGSMIQDNLDRYIKGTGESTLFKDSTVPLMHHDLSDLGSLILIQTTSKERTLNLYVKYLATWKDLRKTRATTLSFFVKNIWKDLARHAAHESI